MNLNSASTIKTLPIYRAADITVLITLIAQHAQLDDSGIGAAHGRHQLSKLSKSEKELLRSNINEISLSDLSFIN